MDAIFHQKYQDKSDLGLALTLSVFDRNFTDPDANRFFFDISRNQTHKTNDEGVTIPLNKYKALQYCNNEDDDIEICYFEVPNFRYRKLTENPFWVIETICIIWFSFEVSSNLI